MPFVVATVMLLAAQLQTGAAKNCSDRQSTLINNTISNRDALARICVSPVWCVKVTQYSAITSGLPDDVQFIACVQRC